MTGKVSLGGRFSMAACVAPSWLVTNALAHVSANPAPRTVFSAAVASTVSDQLVASEHRKGGIVVFGGVTAERDYNDVWLLIES